MFCVIVAECGRVAAYNRGAQRLDLASAAPLSPHLAPDVVSVHFQGRMPAMAAGASGRADGIPNDTSKDVLQFYKHLREDG